MLKAGIVGCGFMGRMHANVYRALPDVELVAAVDYKSDRGRKYAEEFGLSLYDSVQEMVKGEGLDIVDVCVPTHMHRDYTIQAAEMGCHVFCEKPMALSLEDADAMIAACEKAGVKLMIGHCIRFWPEYVILKELVDSKQLGELTSINLTRYGGFPAWASDGWNLDEEKCGGGVLDMHIHDTDYILHLLGEPEKMISHGTMDDRGAGHVFTTMTYRDGKTIAHLEGGWNLPPNAPFKMAFRAIFEHGAAIWDAGPMMVYENGMDPVQPNIPKMKAEGGGNLDDLGGYYHELRYFTDKIMLGQPLVTVTPQTSRQSLDYCLQEIEQIKKNSGA